MRMIEKEFYTVMEACAILGIHPQTLRRAEKAGKLLCVRTPGGRRRIPASEIVRLATPTQPSKIEA
jgi:putative resolvase